jgi:heptosyltransferase-2
MTTLVFAPNWLGDVVMALPAISDIRHSPTTTRLVVAARPSVAGLFSLVPGIDRVISLSGGGGLSAIRALGEDVRTIREVGADIAILLPNSIHTAILAARAGIPERWGYARDLRRVLLTQAVPRAKSRLHQAEYYRHLVRALRIDPGPLQVPFNLPAELLQAARGLLTASGWNGSDRLVAMAPGAAYGAAKQWPPAYFARLAVQLADGQAATSVLLGSAADARVAHEIAQKVGKMSPGGPVADQGHSIINLAGRTSLTEMVGVMAHSRAVVSNDSGAMHVAAAVGVPVVAMFGPTENQATSPLMFASVDATRLVSHAVLTSPTWCRPCMLRECPLDHACLTGISPDRVRDEVASRL